VDKTKSADFFLTTKHCWVALGPTYTIHNHELSLPVGTRGRNHL